MNQQVQPPPMYSFNPESAKKADAGAYINQSGYYIGQIKEAKHIQARTGTQGIEFTFESNEGQSARYMTLYTKKADGNEISIGMGHVNALLAIKGLNGLQAQPGTALNNENAYLFPHLCGPIGILLEKELYTKANGSDGSKMNIVMFADPQTNQSAKEKMENLPAETLERKKQFLVDIDNRNQPQAVNTNRTAPVSNDPGPDFSDDIPF